MHFCSLQEEKDRWKEIIEEVHRQKKLHMLHQLILRMKKVMLQIKVRVVNAIQIGG
jgi:hypothetical protein